ncbi:gamma-glutamyl-gamma-aminobutyrate hydrolase family protein [uncultured Corynebacterium sp.]|uniref:gamma-glutamyl-gamma-aminobutyrate hydrolase family protein n=1 Tax=uncultured Corynebacterium sp. TaxID=159447 RepID=UPI0025D36363|nr:gamma-glutamyl-gamma-aminobutyrate hydrolase family protein [uncultured Corynebacterium sp.]
MTPRSPLHVEVFHPLSVRPDEPGFHDLLGVLNDGVRAATDALGWTVHFTASGEVGADAALAAARRADLLVVMGGEDVTPTLYGATADYEDVGTHCPAADIAEISVIRDAVARRAPLLGICRGLQLINVAFGGTLVQHLPTERLHRADGGDGGDPFVTTTVVPVPGADADGLDLSSPVRCTHHQAVGDLGAGLTVVARASDGVVEAVLHEDAPLTGVQWHPEHPEVAGAQLTALLRRMRGQLGPQGRGGQGVTRPGAVAS